MPWALMNRRGPDHARYGISHDVPSITAPEQCRYDACAEVAPDFVAKRGAIKTTLPSGRYAVLKFREGHGAGGGRGLGCTAAGLAAIQRNATRWPAVLRVLPQGGVMYDLQTGVFVCGICNPVAALFE